MHSLGDLGGVETSEIQAEMQKSWIQADVSVVLHSCSTHPALVDHFDKPFSRGEGSPRSRASGDQPPQQHLALRSGKPSQPSLLYV